MRWLLTYYYLANIMASFSVSQTELVITIIEFLENKGITDLLPRELNVVIDCATTIVNELRKPDKPVIHDMGLTEWLASDRTGLSSLFMAGVLGGFSRPYAYPRDPSDFGRCLGLLDAVPEFRARIGEMKGQGPEWSALIGAWDELESLFLEEKPLGLAPRCYYRMKELLKDNQEIDC